ncbi:MAG: hypothetical protein B7Y36_15700 [Novosphingobium sp. 28-62-57]|uniref:hypothetical protein n=1 Tax=unclassified Novosphingobium TaxID=2644732 RepID=UPI000BC53B29|nr:MULTISPECIES: hypothetical protein [unclassified Novosphingobium]OYW47565.1 MAG: hypothetical protein B7Z36_02805 [Novosphingobium sp. 12-63-9]OYZ08796.1 MAG: hypothetical protein B7Y36_15700 [Novosphingobium sp. 28-62-57]OZA37651.1 MAG: hypothetical protein B7X92_04535 [Novosphingobium sp. 17-62-9]HQS70202.1 hypothetical protein [Novosphingobium sp.]
MIIRAGTGWQYALADLSLILFLATASALSLAGKPEQRAPAPPAAPPPAPLPVAAALESAPVAVWAAGAGAPPLAGWLQQVGNDPRLEVQIVVRYAGGGREAALEQALKLAQTGGVRAQQARILVEPGDRAGASVALFYASEQTATGPVPLAR